jgi:hypothetical protein
VIAEEVRAHLAAAAGTVALVRLVVIDAETASHLLDGARALW